jgi:hypothetical protein
MGWEFNMNKRNWKLLLNFDSDLKVDQYVAEYCVKMFIRNIGYDGIC